MTVLTWLRMARLLLAVSRMYSDSGVVTRMCGGRFSISRRSFISVSPVRTAVRISGISSRAGRPAQDLAQRDFEVLLDVVAQRLQRRNVENFGAVAQFAGERLAHQAIDADEECGERFARSSGSGDQRRAAGKNLAASPALAARSACRSVETNHSATSGCAQDNEAGMSPKGIASIIADFR